MKTGRLLNTLISVMVATCAAIWVFCSNPVSGGATDSPNLRVASVRGTALNEDSSVAGNTLIRIRPANYLSAPDDSANALAYPAWEVTTDARGQFQIDSLLPGSYFIEANNLHGQVCGRRVTVKNDTLLAPVRLAKAISVRGAVSADDPSGKRVYVFVYGLERRAIVDLSSGSYSLDDLPASPLTLRFASLSTELPVAERTIDSVSPGDSIRLGDISLSPFYSEDYSGWLHSRRIFLNTTQTGANVAETVTKFPVLVRLDSTNFVFSQAQPGGSDIRFARGNTKLRYEVDSWNWSGRTASVWVLVDTITGNDSTGLTMYWGHDQAADFSNGSAVFDTANGFAGVWHMNLNDSYVHDATGNRNHGFARNYDGDEEVAGISGTALRSDRSRAHILVENAPSIQLQRPMTVSAWIKGQGYGKIVSKGVNDNREYAMYLSGESYKAEIQIAKDPLTSVYARTGLPTSTGTWNFVAFVYDGNRLSFQTNRDYSETNSTHSGPLNTTSWPLMIQAGSTGGDNLHLPLDELRISTVARSKAWMKLSWENQKPADALVVFGE